MALHTHNLMLPSLLLSSGYMYNLFIIKYFLLIKYVLFTVAYFI